VRATVLVYGYGNPGRLDDGLGPALARALGGQDLGAGVRLETGYQLQIEDAALVAEHDVVVFADADTACAEPFELRPLRPRREASFSTHSLAPEAVLALAHEHLGARTRGFVLGIRGYHFDDYGERLSPAAERNLELASAFVARALRDGRLASGSPCTAPGGETHGRGD
jgi:hydrogenase maturation protease